MKPFGNAVCSLNEYFALQRHTRFHHTRVSAEDAVVPASGCECAQIFTDNGRRKVTKLLVGERVCIPEAKVNNSARLIAFGLQNEEHIETTVGRCTQLFCAGLKFRFCINAFADQDIECPCQLADFIIGVLYRDDRVGGIGTDRLNTRTQLL